MVQGGTAPADDSRESRAGETILAHPFSHLLIGLQQTGASWKCSSECYIQWSRARAGMGLRADWLLAGIVSFHIFRGNWTHSLSFKKKFAYLFLAALGLYCCAWAFSSCSEHQLKLLSIVVPRLLTMLASPAAVHWL